MLGFCKKKQINSIDPSTVKKILVLKYDRIGDMVIATPVFREIKKRIPNVELVVLASNINRPIIENNPYIDDIFIYSNNWIKLFPKLIRLRKKKFDVCFEFEAGVVPRSILITKIIKPKYTAAVFKQHGKYGLPQEQLNVYDYYSNYDVDSHRSKNLLDVLNFIKINSNDNTYDLHVSEQSFLKIDKFVRNFDSKIIKIGLNLEGSKYNGKIPATKLKTIITNVSKNHKVSFFILAAPWERTTIDSLIEQLGFKNLYPTYFNISDIQAFLYQLNIVISVDTSIVHIASALNIPIVGIYADDKQNFSQWSPNNSRSKVVFSNSYESALDFDPLEVADKTKELITTFVDCRR